MTPLLHIRKKVLGITQAEMAVLTQVQQATVSRWENGALEPDREQLERIREKIHERGLPWDDSWFFEVPPGAVPDEDIPQQAKAS